MPGMQEKQEGEEEEEEEERKEGMRGQNIIIYLLQYKSFKKICFFIILTSVLLL